MESIVFLEVDRPADIAQVIALRIMQGVGHCHDQASGTSNVGLAYGGLLAGQSVARAWAVDQAAFRLLVFWGSGQQFALGIDDIHRVERFGLQEQTVDFAIQELGRVRALADYRSAVGQLFACRVEKVFRDLGQFHCINAVGLQRLLDQQFTLHVIRGVKEISQDQ
jgi:hypothetical protein